MSTDGRWASLDPERVRLWQAAYDRIVDDLIDGRQMTDEELSKRLQFMLGYKEPAASLEVRDIRRMVADALDWAHGQWLADEYLTADHLQVLSQ